VTFPCAECGFELDPMVDGERCPICGHNPYRTDDDAE